MVSSAVYTVISPTGDQTSNHRMQSRNSTTEPSIHISGHGNSTHNIIPLLKKESVHLIVKILDILSGHIVYVFFLFTDKN